MKLFDATPGRVIDALRTMYPSRLEVVGSTKRHLDTTRTTFGYVLEGNPTLVVGGLDRFQLSEGFYFSVPGEYTLEAAGCVVVVIERYGFRGLLNVGRIEDKGRLSYIDGCSDTLLVSPPRQGDPCLNYLHFPPGIDQTQHTHPSIRFGVVARGAGVAYQAKGPQGDGWEEALTAGKVFLLEEQELHSFRTTRLPEGVESPRMDIIAFHPDTDWGPTDQLHPMLNRTYIGTTPTPGGQYQQ
ncbi:MAG TPA: hypothetical protein VF668_01240 [Pyrinomonadaceae bacterium]|jgi:hypothetical protein